MTAKSIPLFVITHTPDTPDTPKSSQYPILRIFRRSTRGVRLGTTENTTEDPTTSVAVPRPNCRSKPPRILSTPILMVSTVHLFITVLEIACTHVLVSCDVRSRVLRTWVALCVGKKWRDFNPSMLYLRKVTLTQLVLSCILKIPSAAR